MAKKSYMLRLSHNCLNNWFVAFSLCLAEMESSSQQHSTALYGLCHSLAMIIHWGCTKKTYWPLLLRVGMQKLELCLPLLPVFSVLLSFLNSAHTQCAICHSMQVGDEYCSYLSDTRVFRLVSHWLPNKCWKMGRGLWCLFFLMLQACMFMFVFVFVCVLDNKVIVSRTNSFKTNRQNLLLWWKTVG